MPIIHKKSAGPSASHTLTKNRKRQHKEDPTVISEDDEVDARPPTRKRLKASTGNGKADEFRAR
ncbi:hypothetical protein VKT23_020167 [Stygiomarasmius scandens]|uniref:Uncharacterized protein n=1 Tax=Marasmiellus scandens TaxID=2682957 RepID=A0ABR1IN73_9AGAR